MRILILANNDVGLYRFRRELIERLLAVYEVYISLPQGEFVDPLVKLGCRYIKTQFDRRSINPINDLKLLFAYIRMIKKCDPEIVLTYTIKPNVFGGIACRVTGKPYISNITGLGTSIENEGFLKVITLMLYRISLKNSDCIFFQNRPNCDLFIKEKITQSRTRVIPGSGVNLSVHKLEEYPSEECELRFLFIGRVMKDKGIEELLEGAQKVKAFFPQVRFNIVGECDEDYYEILHVSEQMGIIHYYGQQSDIHSFIKESHCTVLPSYHEGTANVLLESAATGRPVITTRVPGCAETFDEGISGFGCTARDVNSLVDAIVRFIKLPRKQKVEMGLAGRKKMERQYDRNIVINAYTEEITKLNGRGLGNVTL